MDLAKKEKIQQQKKEILLNICKDIIKADKSSIKIIKESCVSNIKLIERSSKTLKDPDPLLSTTCLMNQKYPISIDKEKAFKYNVPSDYLKFINNKNADDAHYHNRVLCKLEAISWWIEHSKLPNDNCIQAINVLYKRHREEVSTFFSIDWSKTRLNWGISNVERKMIPTREVPVQIEKSLRTNYLLQLIYPDAVIPYNKLTEDKKQILQSVIDTNSEARIHFVQQLKLILMDLDPRRRVLPVTFSDKVILSMQKHALFGPNFMYECSRVSLYAPKNTILRAIEDFGTCMLAIWMDEGYDYGKARVSKCIREAKIENRLISSWLSEEIEEKKQTKFLKTVLEQEIYLDFNIGELRVQCISKNEARGVTISNVDGLNVKIYIGGETISFSYKQMRGTFTHEDKTINHISTNFTNREELMEALKEIYFFCRINFEQSKGHTRAEAKRSCFRIYEKNMGQPLGIENRNLRLLRYYPNNTRIGKITLKPETECYPKVKGLATISEEFELVYDRNKKYSLENPDRQFVIDDMIVANHPKLYHYFSLKRKLMYMTVYYYQNYIKLLNRLNKKDFCWKNNMLTPELFDYFPNIQNDSRYYINKLGTTPHLAPHICFLYCFCNSSQNENYRKYTPKNVDYTIQGININLMAERGLFVYDTQHTVFKIDGKRFCDLTKDMTFKNEPYFLSGYCAIANTTSKYPNRSIDWLRTNVDKVPNGTKYNTMVNGVLITYERSHTHHISQMKTLFTHMKRKETRLVKSEGVESVYRLTEDMEEVINKRKADFEDIPSKRIKLLELDEDVMAPDDFEPDVYDDEFC